jgi:hypothetical protein
MSSTDNFDYDLIQGLRLRTKKDALAHQDPVSLALLQNTTCGGLGSIVEGFDDPDALSRPLPGAGSTPMGPPQSHTPSPSSPPPAPFKVDAGAVNALNDQFNKLLAKYTALHKQMMSELMINNNRPALQNFAGKNVKHDNNYYYINNFGFSHVYDNEAWKSRSNGCSSEPIDIASDEFGHLLTGPNMGIKQSCNVAGFNISNKSSGEQSWVDIKGVRHVYPKDIWDKRNSSCQGMPRPLTDDEYNSIPDGTKMDSNTVCSKLNVNPEILTNLAKLNAQLLTLGNKLLANTKSLVGGNEHLDAEITKVHNQTVATMKKLEGDKQNLTNNVVNLGHSGVQLNQSAFNNNNEGSRRSSELFLRMNYIKYLVGLIFVVLLVLFSFVTYPSNEQSTIATLILLLVILVVLSHFWSFISSKLF